MNRVVLLAFASVACTTVHNHVTPMEPIAVVPKLQKRGADFAFHGGQEFAVNDPSLPQGAEPRTLTAWFRTGTTEGAHVIANWGTPAVGQRFGLLVDAGRVKLVGEFQDLMTSATFADNEWHHAAATFDGTSAAVYIDGAVQVSGHLQLDTQGDRFVIGNAPIRHAPEWWYGEIDRVEVFPLALDADEIARRARVRNPDITARR